MNKITLTPVEWEIIEHRLGVADAIAQALTDGDDEYPPCLDLPEDTVLDRALELDSPGAIDWESEIDVAIIRDCLDGSTFFSDMYEQVCVGDLSKGKYMSYMKSANNLEAKIGINIPRD